MTEDGMQRENGQEPEKEERGEGRTGGVQDAPGTEARAPVTDPGGLVPILEAVLFSSPEPVTAATFKKVLGEDLDPAVLDEALELLRAACNADGRGIRLVELAGGWQLLTREEYAPFLQRMGRAQRKERLTPASLETLAVVAYKQPVTRAEIDAVRGVSTGPILRTLMDLKLVRMTGRAELPGAPFQYGTTRRFLEHFGLRSTRDLPSPKEVARFLAERQG